MESKQKADEQKIEKERHYDCLEAARKIFRRKPYQIKDVTKYIAKKYGIGGDADGERPETDE